MRLALGNVGPNKCFCVDGRPRAFANIMAYSGYHGEIEGPADEAKEWPAGSGFSHLWGTAQILHSSSCWECWLLAAHRWVPPQELPSDGGSCLTQVLHLPLDCRHLTMHRCWGYKGLLPLPQYGASFKDLPSFRAPFGFSWGLSCSCLTLPTSPFAHFCFPYSLTSIDPRGILRETSICKSQRHFPGENSLCHYLNVLLPSPLRGRI